MKMREYLSFILPPAHTNLSLSLSLCAMEGVRVKKKPLTDRTNFTILTNKPHKYVSYKLLLLLDCSDSETSIGSSNIPLNPPHSLPSNHIGTKSRDVLDPVYRRKKALEKAKDKGEQVSLPLTIYKAEKTRFEGKSAVVPTGKTKDTEKVIPMRISCTSVVNTKNETKENVEPLSCIPLPRTRKKRTVSKESGNICVAHLHPAPQPNRNKNWNRLLVGYDDPVCTLPQDYVEQQIAYFKEVDDFELAEEEISENE